MEFQINFSSTLHENLLVFKHIYFIIIFGCVTFRHLRNKQKSQSYRALQGTKFYVRSASCSVRPNFLRNWFQEESKDTLRNKNWQMQVCLAIVHVIVRHFSAWGWLTTSLWISRRITAAVFLDMDEAFDTTWYSDLLHKLSEFPTSLKKLIVRLLNNSLVRRQSF
jgi:hypothetical protein